jgi:hypothetical protein
MSKYELAMKMYGTPYGFLSWERQGIVLRHAEDEDRLKWIILTT